MVYFHIRRVPDLLSSAHPVTEALDHVPVVRVVKFVAVPPQVEQAGTPGSGAEEGVAQFGKTRVPVMAGGVPGEEILRKVEFFGGYRRAGVHDAQRLQPFAHLRDVGAVGIGHSAHGRAGDLFQRHAVQHGFSHEHVGRYLLHEGMGIAVAGDLHSPVYFPYLVGRQPGDMAALRPGPSVHQASVQVEGAPDAMVFHDPDQPDIRGYPIVITQRKRPFPSTRKKHTVHACSPFRRRIPRGSAVSSISL